MMSTKLASFLRVSSSPNALTRVWMFFLASGRDIARITGFRGFFRKRKMTCNGSTPSLIEFVKRPDSEACRRAIAAVGCIIVPRNLIGFHPLHDTSGRSGSMLRGAPTSQI